MSGQTIKIRPGYHRCHPDPSQNYGIASATMTFILTNDDGWGAEFEIFTDWGLPADEFKAACPDCTHAWHQNGYPGCNEPKGALVRWHSPTPRWEDHDAATDDCDITGGVCYADCGYLVADVGLHLLLTEGSDAVWEWLQGLIDEARLSAAADTGVEP